jgi:hypothetical protein
MKKIESILLAFLLVFTGQSFAQSDAKTKTDAKIKAWQAYMTPAENHKALSNDVGTWKTEITSYMEPNTPPVKSVGTADISMILGDRYQQSIYKGDMMGMPFEGISILGYDNSKKVFVNSWIDNMGTGMMVMEGKWDATGKIITFTGTCVDPTTGKDMKVRQVLNIENEKNQYMEMFMTENGKERKTMELRMTKDAN